MSEIEIWNIMQMGLISNSMYFVGMVLMTWLGFRFAAKMREEQNAELVGKILVSAFYVMVGFSFFNVNMIAGDIISTGAASMGDLEVKSPAAINLIEISNSPANPGNPLTYVFHILIVGMQLLMTWGKSTKV